MRASDFFLVISGLLAAGGWTTTCHAATPPGSASPPCSGSAEPCSTPAPYEFLGLDAFYVYFNFGGGAVWLKPDVAAERGTASFGGALSLSLGFGLFDLVAGEVGVEPLFIGDHAKFEEDVVVLLGPSIGDTTTAKSSVAATQFTAAVGPRTPSLCLWPIPGRDNCWAAHAYFFVGQSWLSGTRAIVNCEDCKTEDLHFDGGTFIEPGLAFGLPSREGIGIGVRTSFRHHLSDATVSNEARLGLELLFL